MFRIFVFISFILFSSPLSAKDCVILLHGLARTSDSLVLMEKSLAQAGFFVVNQGYPSTEAKVATLADEALTQARAKCVQLGDETPHALTHSMGGILLRSFTARHEDVRWGRVVMLGPPNQGSEVIDTFAELSLFEMLNGPAALELGTEGLPPSLPAVDFELGVIAGDQSINPLLSHLIEGRDDGKVSVEKTKVEGMKGHAVMHVTHTFMMQHPVVIAQAIEFLRNGRFSKEKTYLEALRYIGDPD